MARSNALTLGRSMNSAQRMQYNVQLAKRAALCFLTTIREFMKRTDAQAEFTSLGLSITEVSEVFGVWNAAWPTTMQLRNLATKLEERGTSPMVHLDSVVLAAVSQLCKLSAKVADPREALAAIHDLHKKLLLILARYAESGQTWETFSRARERDMNVLHSKLR